VDDFYFVERLRKAIRERRNVVVEAITQGSVQDYAAFRHLRGKLEVWDEIESELRSVLKQQELQDDD
jgi:hypothetical protein